MRNSIIGLIVGLVVGLVFGVTIIAPRLPQNLPDETVAALKGIGQPGTGSVGESVTEVLTKAPAPKPSKPETEEKDVLSGPEVRWRMASVFASDLPQLGSLARRIETEIWRVSSGAIEISFHEPDDLAPVSATYKAVKAGEVEAAFIAPNSWPSDMPALQIFGGLPFGPKAEEYLAWIYAGGGADLLTKLAEQAGVVALPCGMLAAEGSGWFRHPVQTLEDLKGLKVRIDGLAGQVLARLGVEPQALGDIDVLGALEAGTIDGAEFSTPAIDLKLGLHEFAKYYYFPGWHQPSTLLNLIVHPDAWEALTPLQKSQIKLVCGENVVQGLAEGNTGQVKALLELRAEGVEVRRWPREVLRALERSWRDLAAAQSAQNAEFAGAWQALTRFRDNYALWRDLSGSD